ncbi:hypothetical protein JURA_0029 [Escherichia phage vB_Eco_Jura]|uniref:Uncharacterized protein n=1 Tax=Escherichia phage OLB145 TaxID=2448910 RepID=A0A3G3MCF5_9CAUD|nr:hypothetical protein [Escherichia phage OLB145]QXV75775.1 hypothetical protein bas69_0003 [Escherichia phage AlfredRasser]CAE6410397.1 hypothetical protein JURA_0029 [Escherichia phage vB_Eco_Jura]
MYYIEELFCRLANGVLNNTGIVTDDRGDIEDDSKPFIIVAANEALTRLHGRFNMRNNNVVVEMQEGRTNYPLLAKYAVQSYDPNEVKCPFIMDLAGEKFAEDVIRILEVYDDKGRRRPLNDRNNPHSLFTPRPNVLQNNAPKAWEVLNVMYQAKHPKLSTAEDGYNEIDIPDTLDPALDAYIAYRYYTSLNTPESSAKAAEYLSFYDSICREVVEYDLTSDTEVDTNTLFRKRGWR